jgi:hypothetical protein
MSSESASTICGEEGCTIATDGQCLRGLKPEACPSYKGARMGAGGDVRSTSSGISGMDDVRADEDEEVPLPPGGELDQYTARDICASRLSKVIVMAGDVRSGKTTLVASIYDHLQVRPFAGYAFAGSDTLRAFEEKCHLGRVESEMLTPDMERTSRDFERRSLLHLQMCRVGASGRTRDLLFSDINGEVFEKARDSTEFCQSLGILRRADHLVILVDGRKLRALTSRHEATASPRAFLRRCLDSGMVGRASFVDILVSKWDLVLLSGTQSDVSAHLDNWSIGIRRDLEPRVSRLRIEKIAAGALYISGLEPSYGVDSVFPGWVEDSPFLGSSIATPRMASDLREFEKAGIRRVS